LLTPRRKLSHGGRIIVGPNIGSCKWVAAKYQPIHDNELCTKETKQVTATFPHSLVGNLSHIRQNGCGEETRHHRQETYVFPGSCHLWTHILKKRTWWTGFGQLA
jgi:hypothetical protein